MKVAILSEINVKPRIVILIISLFFKILGSGFSAIALAAKNPALGVVSTVICIFWFLLLFLAALPVTDSFISRHIKWLGRLARVSISTLVIAGILEIVFIASISAGIFNGAGGSLNNLLTSFQRIGTYSDATALEHQATENFLDGKNPYAEANVITAGIDFGVPSDKLTPLRTGRFSEAFPYPDLQEIEDVYISAQSTPDEVPTEFETRFNYPAASFILPAPLIALGITDMRIVFLLFLLPALAYVILQSRSCKVLICFIVTIIASLELWNSLFSGGTSLLIFPLLLMTWLLYRKNLWLSAIFLGIAIATKQIAWFLLPFYMVLILREKGFKKVIHTAALTAGVFLVFNLHYIIIDPHLWFNSVMAPMTNDIFPCNVWILTLDHIGLIDIKSSLPFTIIEIITLLIALLWYFFNSTRFPETALVLAIVPLFFAWRGSWGYFFYFDIIILATILLDPKKDKKYNLLKIPEWSTS